VRSELSDLLHRFYRWLTKPPSFALVQRASPRQILHRSEPTRAHALFITSMGVVMSPYQGGIDEELRMTVGLAFF
jgi:hypothetical protein